MSGIELLTSRMVLVSPTKSYSHQLWQYALQNREHLSRWEPKRSPEYFTLKYWESYLDGQGIGTHPGQGVHLVFLPREEPSRGILGQCRLSIIANEPFYAANLGYHLAEHALGQGYMGEGLTRVIQFAFEDLNLHRIQANYMPRNEASGRVLQRLGFIQEGYARDYLRIAGEWEDHILTSLTNPHWRARE